MSNKAKVVKKRKALVSGSAKLINLKVIREDTVEQGRWELHDAMFSVDHMLNRVQKHAQERQYELTLRAIRIMKKYHEGQFRKSNTGEKIPYIIHPLMLACHAFALGIGEDDLIATCLLHDVLEDCAATPADLEMPPEVLDAVRLISFNMIDGLSKEESKAIYYSEIGKNRLASIVKLLDRCNNISTMATGFNKKKMAEYIDETEKYILPLLNTVKHGYDEYVDAAFLLKYQMLSVMETLKRTL